MPAQAIFTGNDYTAAFARRGKIKPYEHMLTSNDATQAFSSLGDLPYVSEDVFKQLNKYTCEIYGTKKNRNETDNVDKKRVLMLRAKIPKRGKNVLKKLKSFDPVSLPPCANVLMQKTVRTNFVAHIWKNAHKQEIPQWDPCDHGWTVENDLLVPVWYTGERVPEQLYHEDEEEDEDDSDDEDPTSDSESESDEEDSDED